MNKMQGLLQHRGQGMQSGLLQCELQLGDAVLLTISNALCNRLISLSSFSIAVTRAPALRRYRVNAPRPAAMCQAQQRSPAASSKLHAALAWSNFQDSITSCQVCSSCHPLKHCF